MEWRDEINEEIGAHLMFYKWNELIDLHEKLINEQDLFNHLKHKPALYNLNPTQLAEYLFFNYH